ncbi:MAG: polysaccharide biosynthesis tyrosine autokinase [Candidatus Omnitrophota bacterium]
MQQPEQEIHLSDYFRVIKNRKKIVLIFFFTVVFIVTLGSFLMQPVYRATVTLFVDIESPKLLTTSGSMSLDSMNYLAYKEYLESQKEIIKSRSIINQVFKEFKLGESREYLASKDPIKKFLGDVKVETVRDTRLMNLYVDNKDPEMAADIANRIAEIFVAHNLTYITKGEIINLHKNEYLKLKTQLSEYSNVYKDKHPKMIRLKEEIAQLVVNLIQEEEGAVVGSMSSPGVYVEVPGSILAGLKANNITIQDKAEVPMWPIKPKKRLNILLAMIVGLSGGIGLVFFIEYLDDTVKNIEDIRRLVEWPFLGSVPDIDSGTKEFDKDLLTHIRPKDPIAESYRAIRTSVLFSSTEEHPLKSIIVTSPGPQEGKTTTLCNLGITMAQNQKQVLLVDADMRKPRLHDVFKTNNEIGLSNFLSGQAVFTDLAQKTEIDNLFLVPGGPYPPNPSELLTSNKMKEFIEKAKTKFDIILFDTSPIAVVTDAVILSQAVDGSIVVLQGGKTSKRVLPRISQLLKEARARIVGVLLNRVSSARSDDYSYHYYYGKTKKQKT